MPNVGEQAIDREARYKTSELGTKLQLS